MSADSLVKQIIFWPANVLPALLRGNVLPAVMPLFGALTQYWWFKDSPAGYRAFMIYIGAGVGNMNIVRAALPSFSHMYVGREWGSGHKNVGADIEGPGDTLGGAGPLGNYQLAPITPFERAPPIPRNPLGAGGNYALHHEEGYNEGGMSSAFSGILMK